MQQLRQSASGNRQSKALLEHADCLAQRQAKVCFKDRRQRGSARTQIHAGRALRLRDLQRVLTMPLLLAASTDGMPCGEPRHLRTQRRNLFDDLRQRLPVQAARTVGTRPHFQRHFDLMIDLGWALALRAAKTRFATRLAVAFLLAPPKRRRLPGIPPLQLFDSLESLRQSSFRIRDLRCPALFRLCQVLAQCEILRGHLLLLPAQPLVNRLQNCRINGHSNTMPASTRKMQPPFAHLKEPELLVR
jgi:hypothetical protein